MLSEEEEVLLAALQRGENEAFRTLMRRYGSMLFGYAQRILNNADEAQEILQETMVSVFQHIGSFEKRCSLRSFLFRLVHHKAIDLIRRNRRYVALPDTPPYADAFDEKGGWKEPPTTWDTPERQLDARRMLGVVHQQIQHLPHNYREILLLREIHQLDTEEVCNVLGVSAVHARVMLHRARQALYKLVDEALQQAPSSNNEGGKGSI